MEAPILNYLAIGAFTTCAPKIKAFISLNKDWVRKMGRLSVRGFQIILFCRFDAPLIIRR